MKDTLLATHVVDLLLYAGIPSEQATPLAQQIVTLFRRWLREAIKDFIAQIT